MKKATVITSLIVAVAVVFLAWAAEVVLIVSGNDAESMKVVASFKANFKAGAQEFNLGGSDEKARTVGEELKAKKPKVAVVVGDLAAQLAKWYLEGVPVVYCNAGRAQAIGLTSNAVGIYHEPRPEDQLNALPELFPERKKVGVLYAPQFVKLKEADLRQKAQALGLSLEFASAGSVKDVPEKLRQLLPNVQVLWVLTDPTVLSAHSHQYIVLQAVSAKVPIFCGDRTLARSGATAGLVPDLEDAGRLAGLEAQNLLTGAKPAAGALRYPKGRILLNLKTAALLQITFPPAVQAKASETIK